MICPNPKITADYPRLRGADLSSPVNDQRSQHHLGVGSLPFGSGASAMGSRVIRAPAGATPAGSNRALHPSALPGLREESGVVADASANGNKPSFGWHPPRHPDDTRDLHRTRRFERFPLHRGTPDSSSRLRRRRRPRRWIIGTWPGNTIDVHVTAPALGSAGRETI